MYRTDQHPDIEILDRLRAGLLDERPRDKAKLQAHLEACPQCRRASERFASVLAGEPLEHPIRQRLEQARRDALRRRPARRATRFALPAAAAAAVALLALIVIRPEPPVQDTLVAETGAREVPALYEELDFYLWLADHKASKGDSAT